MTSVEGGTDLSATMAQRWPDVARQPRNRLRAAVAERLFRYAVARLPIRVFLLGPSPDRDGELIGGGGGDAPVLRIARPEAFFHRLGVDQRVGFGESYLAGEWTAGEGWDLGQVLTPFADALTNGGLVPVWLRRLRRFVDLPLPGQDDASLETARRNVSHHYDLSNELFRLFLDPTLSYSGALFEDPTDPGADLEDAQIRKIDHILDDAGVTAGTRLLEIGTGWGALAVRAARRGADVTSVTISAEQHTYATDLVEREGLSDRVDVRLQDYREVTGTFDAIVSVEMIEAVGERGWPVYFAALDRLLAPGGRIGLQAIVQTHEVLVEASGTNGWIHKYIFPGGAVPSLRAIEEVVAENSDLAVIHRRHHGSSYARTLQIWRARFMASSTAVDALGFDETFVRLWELYLAYAESGFNAGYLDVTQLTLVRV